MIRPPAPRPCESCPYRRDVPSGVWDASEYAKLPAYDNDTASQPAGVFLCHQQDGRVCAGWAGCHDMDHSFALRIASATGQMAPEAVEATLGYESPVALFGSGAEAAAHGTRDFERPDRSARRVIGKLESRRR